MQTNCDKAVKQISENKYAEQFIDDCYQKVISYGIAFYGKSCRVKLGDVISLQTSN